jgi:hypothetical protein
MRLNWFNGTPGALKKTRNYAGKRSATFNFEVKHKHFRIDCNLSIKESNLLSYTAESLEAQDKLNNKWDLKTYKMEEPQHKS